MNIKFAVTTITVFSIIACVVEVSNATSAKLIAQSPNQNTTPRSNQIPSDRSNQPSATGRQISRDRYFIGRKNIEQNRKRRRN